MDARNFCGVARGLFHSARRFKPSMPNYYIFGLAACKTLASGAPDFWPPRDAAEQLFGHRAPAKKLHIGAVLAATLSARRPVEAPA